MNIAPHVQSILHTVADLEAVPEGAYNIRLNGKSIGRLSSLGVSIVPRADGNGIEIHVKPGTKNETVHIPVVIDREGFTDVVYNDFFIGEGCENILIVAGCGIHNTGCEHSRHDGIHSFHLAKNAQVVYREKHFGSGSPEAGRILNPITNVYLGEGASFEMESVQIEGVDSTHRVTKGVLADDSSLSVTEKLMTDGVQKAVTEFVVDLNGKNSKAHVVSRSVARGDSYQEFLAKITGNDECVGHSECDAIIMDNAVVKAIPEVTAMHLDASLIHEAVIGRIAGEQLTKLMTLGMTAEDAEARIISGFLK